MERMRNELVGDADINSGLNEFILASQQLKTVLHEENIVAKHSVFGN